MVEVRETNSESFLRKAITTDYMYFEANGQLNIFLEIIRHKNKNGGLRLRTDKTIKSSIIDALYLYL